VTERESPADPPDEAKPAFDGFEAALEQLFRAKPEIDVTSEAARQRIRDRAADEPPTRSGRPRT
jgi:hypothetical protein